MVDAPRGVFVTGTDTGVGKTHVACRLLRELRARGHPAAPFKPVASGGDADAHALRAAAGAADLPLDAVAPYRFALAAAPAAAAEAEGRRVDLARVVESCGALVARGGVVVVEGAGGWLVPVAPGVLVADLAAALGLPVLVVARARLGTINHTLLTVREIERRGLALLGTLLNAHEADTLDHARWIAAFDGRLLGTYPDGVDWESLVGVITRHR